MNRIMLFALLGIAFVMSCQSGEYRQAYEYAKNEGRSELFAKAYAEKVDEGKGTIYAKDYADAFELNSSALIGIDVDKELFAALYADKKFEGKTREYAISYAIQYCTMLPVFKKDGDVSEEFMHAHVTYYLEGLAFVVRSGFREEFIKYFAGVYTMKRLSGMTPEQAVVATMNSSIKAGVELQ